MKTLVPTICCVCLSLILAGCNKQREIPGEIFTRDSKGIVKQSGAVLHFLTATQHEKFELLLKDWRDNEYRDARELWDKTYREYKVLVDKHKREDGNVHDQDVIRELQVMEKTIEGAKVTIENKTYDKEISLDHEPIKQFLTSVHRTAADAEGKFKVILSLGQEYWIVAECEIGFGRFWYFRYTPDGTRLVLSDGNRMR